MGCSRVYGLGWRVFRVWRRMLGQLMCFPEVRPKSRLDVLARRGGGGQSRLGGM